MGSIINNKIAIPIIISISVIIVIDLCNVFINLTDSALTFFINIAELVDRWNEYSLNKYFLKSLPATEILISVENLVCHQPKYAKNKFFSKKNIDRKIIP